MGIGGRWMGFGPLGGFFLFVSVDVAAIAPSIVALAAAAAASSQHATANHTLSDSDRKYGWAQRRLVCRWVDVWVGLTRCPSTLSTRLSGCVHYSLRTCCRMVASACHLLCRRTAPWLWPTRNLAELARVLGPTLLFSSVVWPTLVNFYF